LDLGNLFVARGAATGHLGITSVVDAMSGDKQITIVIVDDHESKRTRLRQSLAQVDGFKITGEAADGLTALHKAVDLKPQVVLVDAALAEDDGIEVTRRIHDELPDAAIMMMASQGFGID